MSAHDEIEKARRAALFRAEADRLEALGDSQKAAMQKLFAHMVEQGAYQDEGMVLRDEDGGHISLKGPAD